MKNKLSIKEIKEGNKLIAEFIGWKYFDPKPENKNSIAQDGYWLYYNGKKKGLKIVHPLFSTSAMYGLYFYESWDWLMVVIEYIESIREQVYSSPLMSYEAYYVEIQMGGCTIESVLNHRIEDGEFKKTYSNTIWTNNKRMSTWQAIVEFIKWYNNK